MVGFFSRVNPQMGLQISLFIERSLTLLIWTFKLFLASVSFQMYIQSLHSAVRLVAVNVGANKLFHFNVGVHVVV